MCFLLQLQNHLGLGNNIKLNKIEITSLAEGKMFKLSMGRQKGQFQSQVTAVLVLVSCYTAALAVRADLGLSDAFLKATEPASLRSFLADVPEGLSLNTTCLNSADNYTTLQQCLKTQCVSLGDLAALYSLSTDTVLQKEDLSLAAPAIIFSLQQSRACLSGTNRTDKHQKKPSSAAVWGYSFLFVTLINLCSLTGILLLPCMKMSVYKTLLMFMVSLAVGTLLASGILVLIPEAFELVNGENEDGSHGYVWTATTVMGGVYLFFVLERIMRMINEWRENTKEKRNLDEMVTRDSFTSSFTRRTPKNASLKLKDPSTVPVRASSGPCACMEETQENLSPEKTPLPSIKSSMSEKVENIEEESMNGALMKEHGKMHGAVPQTEIPRRRFHRGRHHNHSHHHAVAPVAYMIIFGDGVHNFIDGLSIGAAFTESILVGVSVAVAVMCEELPHELGDFAILLNAGMRLKKALLFNFLSSMMCYLGLVIGILLSENTTAHTWIFGLAGGMFLYISLADMMPEMNSAAESEDGRRFGVKKTFLLQNVGLITGYCIILIIALFGGHIRFE